MDTLWQQLREQALTLSERNPILKAHLEQRVLRHASFHEALASHLALQLQPQAGEVDLSRWFTTLIEATPGICAGAAADITRVVTLNPACPNHLSAFLTFRGIQAVQAHRIAHSLWSHGDATSAVLLQNWAANCWAIDIHPAARLGKGLFVDHGIGLVIGETAIVEDEVSLWHGVTLGSTLGEAGVRHPHVRRGALVCAGATVLGNIEVGENAIVAANAVVLKPVTAGSVVAGTPARVVGQAPSSLATISHSPDMTQPEARQ